MNEQWQRLNQQLLAAEMARITQSFAADDPQPAGADAPLSSDMLRRQMERPDAITSLQRRLGL